MVLPQNAISVFLSYASQDEMWLQELEAHLSLFKNQGVISTWYNRLVVPGNHVSQEVEKHLEEASIILLLVSSDFLASKYYYNVEMELALKWEEMGQARVIPIIVRPVYWKDAPFGHLQPLPRNAKAISIWENRDEAFVDVVVGIRQTIEDLSMLPASVTRAALPDIWNIPYPRNSFFTGRDELLLRLHEQFQVREGSALSQTPQALSGLGGIGKTQMAVEYAYRYAQEYAVVLWARAENTEVLTASYTAIARLLKLRGSQMKDQEITIRAVKEWLQSHQNWLLILDNADDLDLLLPFLPARPGGHILLTTRAQSTGKVAQSLEVETFDQDEGARLLLRRTNLLTSGAALQAASPDDLTLARAITQELGGLPLALDQAGAYIEETASSLADYQRLYRTHSITLLEARRDLVSDHPEPVVTTWSLSFQRVEQKNPAAADLLRLCACLAPDAIPEEIISRGAAHLGKRLALVGSEPFLLSEAIEALRAYSLLKRDARTHSLSMHRLVQAVVRENMKGSLEKEWKQRAVLAVAAASPDVEDVAQWEVCERWIPHALVCARWMEEEQISSPETASMLNTAASYLSIRTRYREAETLYLRALAIREQQLGPEHPDTATSLNRLGRLYHRHRGYALAEFFYQRALAIREQKLGPEHLDTAESLSSLGDIYSQVSSANPNVPTVLSFLYQIQRKFAPAKALYQRTLTRVYPDQDKFALAEPLYQRALAIREKRLGPEHPDTAESLDDLAAHYWIQGKFALAEPLYQRALAIREKRLGPEHPDTAESLYHLALFYHSQVKAKKYKEAESLYQRAIMIKEQKLGAMHPGTIDALNKLLLLYINFGRFEKAEPFLRRALAIGEQQLGPDDPDLKELREAYALVGKTAWVMRSGRKIWEWLPGQHEDKEVELLTQHPLAIKGAEEEIEGLELEGLDTAQSFDELAFRAWKQEKYAEAEPFYQQALSIREKQLGMEHPDTLRSLNSLAFNYELQGKYEEAEPLYQRLLAMNEQKFGASHPDTIRSLNSLASVYRFQGDHAQAIAMYDRMLLLEPQNALIYSYRGYVYSLQSKYEQAIADYDQAIALDRWSAMAYNGRGNSYHKQGNYSQAIANYDQAILIDAKNAIFYNNRGYTYHFQNEVTRAIADFGQAILLNPKNADAYFNRGNAYRSQGKYMQAITDYDQAILLNSKFAPAYLNRGNAYRSQGNSIQAFADYDQAILLDPNFAPAYFNRGVAYYMQHDYPQAIVDLDQAILLDPEYAEAYNQRGNIYANQGTYTQALANYDQAILLQPKKAIFYSNRGYTYYLQGDYTGAIVDLNQAIELDGKDATEYYTRGHAYAARREYTQAFDDYKQALELDPNDAFVQDRRGLAQSAQQDYRRVLATLDEMILLDPNDARISELRQRFSDRFGL